MRYTDVRPTIKSGDVLVWSYRGWNSIHGVAMELVSFATRSKFNHVGIAVVVSGRVMVLEATLKGVKLNPLSEELPCYLITMPEYWNEDVERFAFSAIGDKYSVWQAILGWLGLLKPGSDKRWQCAELVNMVLSTANVLDKVSYVPTTIVENLLEAGLSLRFLEKQEP